MLLIAQDIFAITILTFGSNRIFFPVQTFQKYTASELQSVRLPHVRQQNSNMLDKAVRVTLLFIHIERHYFARDIAVIRIP